ADFSRIALVGRVQLASLLWRGRRDQPRRCPDDRRIGTSLDWPGFAAGNVERSITMNAHVATLPRGVMDRVLEYVERACDRVDREAERIEQYTAREPGRALWLALGAGVLLALLVKRH